MSMGKRVWRGLAISANAHTDEIGGGGQVGRLVVRIAPDRRTPIGQFGREIEVILSRPMLEILCRIAEDVGAVEYVEPLHQR